MRSYLSHLLIALVVVSALVGVYVVSRPAPTAPSPTPPTPPVPTVEQSGPAGGIVGATQRQTAWHSAKVKLAVLVVFDQMRGDYLERWQPLFGPNGFVRLQREGAWFTHCHYPYATTTTGPGHASMLTGACPDAHGIVNNLWAENGRPVYCAGNERHRLVPPLPEFPPDPDEKGKPSEEAKFAGSPDWLLSETIADVLKESTGGKAKVFGLSLKDRSAILPTGKRPDGAYWFYGVFGTSSYYSEQVHPWVDAFNKSKASDKWFGKDWTRFKSDVDYTKWSGADDASGEGKGYGQGVTFPHPTTGGKPALGKKYYQAVANSPYGNDLLLEFAKTCITAEGLGADEVPDLLVVSFSSNDLIGHTWGPDSHEVLDVTLRSDALVAELLAFLDDKVGKGQYLLGITADHGICPLPEVSRTKEIDAQRIDTSKLRQELDAHLSAMFPTSAPEKGKSVRWVEQFVFPWVYLNPKLVAVSGKPHSEIASEAAKFLATRTGVFRTFTRETLAGALSSEDTVAQQVKRSFYPTRSGDVYVLLKPYYLPSGSLATGTTHGAPYEYDTHVPLLVYGPGIRGGIRTESTTPQAMASIFANRLRIRQPKDAAFPPPTTLE
ncbi:MAG: alkaline phosphatase family protein [Planctomycetia bacterium]|nr:alkaline phosphatase family protein [Planctomycetia bacterium]